MMNQLILNGIIAASVYTLVAIGFAVIYRTVRFFHFAHGVVFTAGAYFTCFFKVWLGWPVIAGINPEMIEKTLAVIKKLQKAGKPLS